MKYLFIFGTICLISSWAKSVPENPEALRTVSNGMNQFAKEFYKKKVEGMDENYLISPVSVSTALLMTTFGASGNTKKEMQTGLRMPEDDTISKSGSKSLIDQFKDISKVDLKIANKIFTNKGLELKSEFKDLTEKNFNAGVDMVDFSKPAEASQTINNWAADKTNNRIQNLLKADDVHDASMVLVNAVYFKGTWQEPFDVEETHSEPFNINEATVKDVPMMTKHGRFNYGELSDLNAKFIELPYEREQGSNKYVAMMVIVPNEINGLRNVENKLDSLNVDLIRANSRKKRVHLHMPKFKVESTTDLKPILQNMGMNDMFADTADFSGITSSLPLKISKTVQKAFIDVNEEGSEAAAATAVVALPKSAGPGDFEIIHLKVDRPFYYAIVMVNNEIEGGQMRSILFQGRVVNPSY